MKNEDVKNKILNYQITSKSNLCVDLLDKVLKQPKESMSDDFWGYIMKGLFMNHKLFKLATLTIIIVAAMLLTTNNYLVGTAYAFDQTLEALGKVRTLRMVLAAGQATTEITMKVNSQTGKADHLRADEIYTGKVTITIPGQTYIFDPRDNTVTLEEKEFLRNDWNFKDPINSLIKDSADVGVDLTITNEFSELAQQDVIVVAINKPDGSKIGEFIVDLETKLPLYIGVPIYGDPTNDKLQYLGPIEYNVEIPDDLFDFKIPQDSKVIDKRSEESKLQGDDISNSDTHE